MNKSLLKEGLASRIAQLIFKGHAKRLQQDLKDDKQLQRAIENFDKASKDLDKSIKQAQKSGVLGKDLKVGKVSGPDW